MPQHWSISFLLLISTITFVGGRDLISQLREQLEDEDSPFISLRNKRQAENVTADPNDGCVLAILGNMENKLNLTLTPLKNVSKAAALSKPHLLFADSDTNNLEKFCKIYKSHRTRLIKCPSSKAKKFALNGLAIVEYICVEHFSEFMASFPCLQKIDNQLDEMCGPQCAKYEGAAEQLNANGGNLGRNKNKEEVEKVFGDSCLYVMCTMKCESPMVKEKCGAKIAELEEGAIGKSFTSLESIMNDSGAGAMWPADCKPLGKMGKAH